MYTVEQGNKFLIKNNVFTIVDDETYNKVMISIKDNSKMIGQFLENIYISDKEKIITWVEDNFLNEDDTINFIKINKYVSGRDNIKVTKW